MNNVNNKNVKKKSIMLSHQPLSFKSSFKNKGQASVGVSQDRNNDNATISRRTTTQQQQQQQQKQKITQPNPVKSNSNLKRKNEDNSQIKRNIRKDPYHHKPSNNQQPESSPARSIYSRYNNNNNNNNNNKNRTVKKSPSINKKKPLKVNELEAKSEILARNQNLEILRKENKSLGTEVETLKADQNKWIIEKENLEKESNQDNLKKSTLLNEVCQKEHFLACEEAKLVELEEKLDSSRKNIIRLNEENKQFDMEQVQYKYNITSANDQILIQFEKLTEQQSQIEILEIKLKEQEERCQEIRDQIAVLKAK
ncbi:hypothetical protein Glove_212g43 [Diversispora epigaea]|uniref:Uncharacterized protein n=1 Tax=Diversispora epigaea TaxID=1348612 RepID=A0A397IRN6_9GLOM|nr:hypothetical protein Glove_212g43 [Diversispora epigaea]